MQLVKWNSEACCRAALRKLNFVRAMEGLNDMKRYDSG